MKAKKTIDKVFILAGGLGSRLNTYGKHNLKAFIEIDDETLIERQIRIINKIVKPGKIFIVITKQISTFKKKLSYFDNIDFIEVQKDYSYKGLLFAFNEIEKKLSKNEMFILSLVDEFYNEEDINEFYQRSQINDFSLLAAIKKFSFPEEYFKNYGVIIDEKNNLILESVEKSKTIISDFYGTGLLCTNKDFCNIVKDNLNTKDALPLYSLISQHHPSKFHILKREYVNINSRVDLYNLKKIIKKNKQFKIDLIIPAYKEEKSIRYVVNDFKDKVDNIIIANKTSTDQTEKIALDAGAAVFTDNYSGYGNAIREGIKKSDADIIILAEADGTFRSSDLDKIILFINESDMVIGTRTNPTFIQYGASMDIKKRFFNILYGKFISFLWPGSSTNFTDVGCTYRGFWRKQYNELENNFISTDASFAPELTIEFIQKGYRVVEIPINYYPRVVGKSKISGSFYGSAITALKMLKLILIKRFIYLFKR
jgi:UDP-N-acetylglucosamine diphosphorylase / glucose-1-phosphate thymidylyltransferase / UDP-N-acetylgalactosamine diphosphorylase / glucosamine-1-phosphate N-acetyltransferase / galactosamine-1-phosphate N-acetyltransferase